MSPECDCCWHLIKLNLSKSLLIYMSSVHTPQKCHRILHKCLSLTKYITISKQFHFVKIRNICDASLLGDSYIGHNDFSQRVVIFHKIRLSSLFTTIPHIDLHFWTFLFPQYSWDWQIFLQLVMAISLLHVVPRNAVQCERKWAKQKWLGKKLVGILSSKIGHRLSGMKNSARKCVQP